MAVSRRDHDYFRRIGLAKAESHATAAEAHRHLTIDERLRRSVQLYLRHRHEAAPREDDPTPFYDRARALGLCRE